MVTRPAFESDADAADVYSSAERRMLSEPVAVRESLARCAAVRVFDSELFETYLRCGDDLTLESLLARRLIEIAGGREGSRLYRASPRIRAAAWASWWPTRTSPTSSAPPDLVELSKRLAAHYEKAGWRVECLRQLVVADVNRAFEVFNQIYAEANDGFDLARCQDAVDALSEPSRVAFLPPELRAIRDARQLSITARTIWSTDYYLTGRQYQPRPAAESELFSLLDSGEDSSWLMQRFGHGGIGKTMLLRWFIARVCVARAPDEMVACARIDGDTVDPFALLQNPWLLLLEAADQLNRQLPSGPFRELLQSFGDYRGMLSRVPQSPGAEQIGRNLAEIAEEVRDGFVGALAGGPPVLIVLDTLDEIAARSRLAADALQELIWSLKRVRDAAKELKVILAGRDDLRDDSLVPWLDGLTGVRHIELTGFEPGEATEYLRRRGVEDDDIARAIREKSFGVPFVLALFADWVKSARYGQTADKPPVQAADIEELQDPQREYIVTRILERITDPRVRWALWYSPVPQLLTFDFFREVMLPELRSEAERLTVSTTGAQTLPSGPLSVNDRLDGVPVADEGEAITALWSAVLAMGSTGTWIYREPSASGDSVIVHPEVRPGLRGQLRMSEQPSTRRTFRQLHARAIDHYQRQIDANADPAGSLPAGWLAWTRAIVFHKFQRQDEGALAYWRTAVAQARGRRRLDWVEDLAEMLLGADFHDVAGRRDEVISGQAQYEAEIEVARVAAQAAGRLPGSAGRPGPESAKPLEKARLALNRAVTLRRAGPGQPITKIDYEDIMSALLPSVLLPSFLPADDDTGQHQAAYPRMVTSLPAAVDASGAASGDSALVRARTLAAEVAGPDEIESTDGERVDWPDRLGRVLEAYEESFDAYAADPASSCYVALEVVDWLLSMEQPRLSLDWCDRADRCRTDTGIWVSERAALKARAMLAIGRPGGALEVLGVPSGASLSSEAPDVSLSLDARCLVAEAQLMLRRPIAAISVLSDDPASGGSGEPLSAVLVDSELLLARAYGELLEIERARKHFDRAQNLIGGADLENQARITGARGLFELDVVGDLLASAFYLNQEFVLDKTALAWTALRLARARLASRQERYEDVERILAEVRSALTGPAFAARRLQAALTGLLATGSAWLTRRPAYLDLIAAELTHLSADARLVKLAELRRCQPVRAADHTTRLLRELVLSPPQAEHGGDHDHAAQLDLAWRKLAQADLLRVIGASEEARRLRSGAMFSVRNDSFILWDLLASGGGGSSGSQLTTSAGPELFEFQYRDYPLLRASFLTEWVDLHRTSDPEAAVRWLSEAARLIAEISEPTAHHARLDEVQAWCLGVSKDPGDRDRARELRDEAREVWAKLGDNRAELPITPETSYLPAAPSASGAIRELVLTADEERGADGPARPGATLEQSAHVVYVPKSIADLSLGIDADALQWSRRAGRRLAPDLEPALADVPVPNSLDVRTDFTVGRFDHIPWELAEVNDRALVTHPAVRFTWRGPSNANQQRHQVLYVQRALSALGFDVGRDDGIAGEKTESELSAFHETVGLGSGSTPSRGTWRELRRALKVRSEPRRPQLRVHLLQPVVGGSLDTLRRFSERVDRLTEIYRAAYNSASGRRTPQLILERTTAGIDISRLLHGAASVRHADVLHVCTVMEANSQMPVLGLDLDSRSPLTVSALNDIIRKMSGVSPPLLVLDVLAPPSPVDTRGQLLKRNRFAQQLLELGEVETIIATGLAQQDSVHQWSSIAAGLATQKTAAEICRRIQRLPLPAQRTSKSAREAHAIAYTATALFSNIHPETMIEPGLLRAATLEVPQ